jgi:hypothetical protein
MYFPSSSLIPLAEFCFIYTITIQFVWLSYDSCVLPLYEITADLRLSVFCSCMVVNSTEVQSWT